MISSNEVPGGVKFIETESRMMVARVWGREQEASVLTREDVKIQEVVGGDDCTMMRMYLIPLNYTLKMIKMVNVLFFYHN